ncbi:hypothetical protein PybrP1_013042 [[Pythium] brassicae (nom. inval.)]|nr:hypothetical protein PybrP1_013042 [[Pythium] brassicae (nom. inval.)]
MDLSPLALAAHRMAAFAIVELQLPLHDVCAVLEGRAPMCSRTTVRRRFADDGDSRMLVAEAEERVRVREAAVANVAAELVVLEARAAEVARQTQDAWLKRQEAAEALRDLAGSLASGGGGTERADSFKELLRFPDRAPPCPTLYRHKILEAILNAVDRGVVVRIVADYGQSLDRASVLHDSRCAALKPRWAEDAVVHAKYIVIDGSQLLMGSMNLSRAGMATNIDTLAVFETGEIVFLFAAWFDELWELETTQQAETRRAKATDKKDAVRRTRFAST